MRLTKVTMTEFDMLGQPVKREGRHTLSSVSSYCSHWVNSVYALGTFGSILLPGAHSAFIQTLNEEQNGANQDLVRNLGLDSSARIHQPRGHGYDTGRDTVPAFVTSDVELPVSFL
jgi:hypothetical protein